jgi:hypothetical protein
MPGETPVKRCVSSSFTSAAIAAAAQMLREGFLQEHHPKLMLTVRPRVERRGGAGGAGDAGESVVDSDDSPILVTVVKDTKGVFATLLIGLKKGAKTERNSANGEMVA